MSRTDDYGLDENNRETQEHSHRVFDHTAEIASRVGLTHDAAKQEMEKFLGVAEYETRKLVGQHSALRQPSTPAPAGPTRRKRAGGRPDAQPVEREKTPVPEAPEAPVPAVDAPESRHAGPDQTEAES